MEESNLNIKFLERLNWEGVTEISDLTHNLWGLEDYENIVKIFSNSDLFFISFVPNEKREEAKNESGKSPRTKNEYIWEINYFKADFDIRSYIYEHEGRVISNEELLRCKDKIINALKQDKLLGTYNAVVLSGNGVHIYWIWKYISGGAKLYAAESTELYNRIKELLPDNPELRPDYSCGNVWRLLRLPGSYNHKSKYGLPPQKVELIEYTEEDSPLVEVLDAIWMDFIIDELAKIETLRNDMKHKCNTRAKLAKNWDEFERINSMIDIAELVWMYTGWELADDGVNFVSCRDGKNTWAYIIPSENIVVHTGTPHFSDYFKVYSPFAFILVHYANFDTKATFQIAEEMFPEVKDERKFLFNKKLVKNGK